MNNDNYHLYFVNRDDYFAKKPLDLYTLHLPIVNTNDYSACSTEIYIESIFTNEKVGNLKDKSKVEIHCTIFHYL